MKKNRAAENQGTNQLIDFFSIKRGVIAILSLALSTPLLGQNGSSLSLDELLDGVKKDRKNSVILNLPAGVHWFQGYYRQGLFYRCGDQGSLTLKDTMTIDDNYDTQKPLYVEFTANVTASGSIKVLEIHLVSTEHRETCCYMQSCFEH